MLATQVQYIYIYIYVHVNHNKSTMGILFGEKNIYINYHLPHTDIQQLIKQKLSSSALQLT
jgi:hypothetical protein